LPSWAEHLVGHVERVLRDEVHADTLGTDQPHDLLDLFQQRRRRIVEQQVGLVEEEGTSFGFSAGRPASGNCSKSSASIQSRKVEYGCGEFISLSAARTLITTRFDRHRPASGR
jgi:hypothetical protein